MISKIEFGDSQLEWHWQCSDSDSHTPGPNPGDSKFQSAESTVKLATGSLRVTVVPLGQVDRAQLW